MFFNGPVLGCRVLARMDHSGTGRVWFSDGYCSTVNSQKPEARYPQTFENRTHLCPNMEWSAICFFPFNNRSGHQMVAKLDCFIIFFIYNTLY
jgi:hypothetical protein